MVSLNGNASIRAFGTCKYVHRKAGVQMSFYHGLGMFLFGTGATLVGAIAVYYVFNKISNKEWIDDDENNNNQFYITDRVQCKV